MKFACKIGLHRWVNNTQYFPSIDAPVLMDFVLTTVCKHCGKIKDNQHYRWNGQEFIKL